MKARDEKERKVIGRPWGSLPGGDVGGRALGGTVMGSWKEEKTLEEERGNE